MPFARPAATLPILPAVLPRLALRAPTRLRPVLCHGVTARSHSAYAGSARIAARHGTHATTGTTAAAHAYVALARAEGPKVFRPTVPSLQAKAGRDPRSRSL